MLQNMNSRDWKQTYINSAVGRYRTNLFGAFGSIIFMAIFTSLAYLYVWTLGLPLWFGFIVVVLFTCVAFFIGYILAIFAEAFWGNGLEVHTGTTILLTLAFMAIHIFYVRFIL